VRSLRVVPVGERAGLPEQQQPGFTHWESFAQYMALHAADTNLVAIPDGVTAEAARRSAAGSPPPTGR